MFLVSKFPSPGRGSPRGGSELLAGASWVPAKLNMNLVAEISGIPLIVREMCFYGDCRVV